MESDKLIMVVGRDALLGSDYFEGFSPHGKVDYEARILDNFKYMKRGVAEKDVTHKQPIGYSMIVNPDLGQVFAYQRSGSEKRLSGKWSWGIGGHIDKVSEEEANNPIYASMLRELGEEVYMDGKASPKVLGYVNDDSDEVGQVHFGVLYVVETDSKIVRARDSEISNGGLKPIEELERICLSSDFTVEGWSKIAFGPLREYFGK